jgi:tetratricopeptide (TPR) repeat protein
MNVDYDPAPRLPVSRGERSFVLLLALGLLGLLGADLAQGFSANKLSVLFVLLFWGPLLVLHELGHALGARLVGWRVTEVVIGFGRELHRFRLGGTRVRVRAVPVEGYVIATPGTLKRARLAQAWIYFAGPLTELLVLAALAPVLDFELPGPGAGVGRVALQSLGLAAALGALCTLFPYRSQGNPSDGLGVLSSWFASEQSFRERLAWPFIEETRRHLLREQLALAEQTLAAGLAHHPGEPRLLGMQAVCRAVVGDAEGAYAALEALGPPEERPAPTRAELLADAAWSVLSAQDAALLPDAERALERALELSAGDPHHEILLGRVLLERGRPEDAYARLMSAYKRTRDVDQEAQCVAYLALACQALRGQPGAERVASYAARFEAALRSHDVPPALRQRALERSQSRS